MNTISTPLIFIFNVIALIILSFISLILLILTLIQKVILFFLIGLKLALISFIKTLDKGAELLFHFIFKYKKSIFIPILFFFFLYLLLVFYRTPAAEVVKKIEGNTLSVYDRNGVLLYSSGDKDDFKYTNPDSFPALFMQAVVASQDKRFFSHNGFDWQVIVGTLPSYFSATKGIPRHTITQQVAEHYIDHKKPAFERFISAVFLTYRLEKNLSKKEILGTYLSIKQVGKVRGMQAAARYYFDRPVSDLNSHELLYLTALINDNNDTNQVEIAKVIEGILQNLIDNTYISKTESKMVRTQEVSVTQRDTYKKAPLLTDYIVDYVYQIYGAEYIMNYGLNVYTSIDLKTQNQLQQIVSENAWKTPGDSSLSLLVVNTRANQVLGLANSNLYNTINQKKTIIDNSVYLYNGITSSLHSPNTILTITNQSEKILYQNPQTAKQLVIPLNVTLNYGSMTAAFLGDFAVASIVHDNNEGAGAVTFIQNDVLNAVKTRILQAQASPDTDLSARRIK